MHSALHTLSSVSMHAGQAEGDEMFVRHSWTPLVHSWGGCLFVTKMLKEGEEIIREEKEREKKIKCYNCISSMINCSC